MDKGGTNGFAFGFVGGGTFDVVAKGWWSLHGWSDTWRVVALAFGSHRDLVIKKI